jgi:hypothetical protein
MLLKLCQGFSFSFESNLMPVALPIVITSSLKSAQYMSGILLLLIIDSYGRLFNTPYICIQFFFISPFKNNHLLARCHSLVIIFSAGLCQRAH